MLVSNHNIPVRYQSPQCNIWHNSMWLSTMLSGVMWGYVKITQMWWHQWGDEKSGDDNGVFVWALYLVVWSDGYQKAGLALEFLQLWFLNFSSSLFRTIVKMLQPHCGSTHTFYICFQAIKSNGNCSTEQRRGQYLNLITSDFSTASQ